MLSLNDILFALIGSTCKDSQLMITEAVIDSRKVIPGALFIALKGERVDGHNFVNKAFDNGALVAIIEKDITTHHKIVDLSANHFSTDEINFPDPPFCLKVQKSLKALQTIAHYWRRKLNIRVIGITGSVGKSSTKELVAEVLSKKYRTHKNPGNYNNEIGLPLAILSLGKGQERLVLEMGFYFTGEITFLCDIALPQVGVLTSVGTVHAERAGSQEKIAKGKAELVQALPSAPDGTAILNYDDPLIRPMAKMTKAKVIFYGLSPEADLWADGIEGNGLKGIQFILHYKNKQIQLRVPLLGRHSVQTVLRAVAVGLVEGLSWEEIKQGLSQGHTQLRLIAVKAKSGALILDDTYNATPESTIAALDLLQELKGQKIAVLGDMLELGQYEHQGHQLVGRRAAEVVQYLIAVGPRGKTIAETAREAGLAPTAITWVESATDATELLQYNLEEGDVVLIKGSHGLRMDRISSVLEEVL
jgi:UDP-N-acetylmuramoyl-tripeptide--D-alanyl-D-alanine ligase